MLIINGKILTMEDKDYENGYLRIKGKIIDALGDMSSCPQAEEGEIVLDAKGAWVMPGIIEAHCHIGIIEEKLGIMGDDCNEETNPVTAELRALDAVNPMDPAFHDAIEAGITSVMVGPGSANVVGGTFMVAKLYGNRADKMALVENAALCFHHSRDHGRQDLRGKTRGKACCQTCQSEDGHGDEPCRSCLRGVCDSGTVCCFRSEDRDHERKRLHHERAEVCHEHTGRSENRDFFSVACQ